MDEAASLKIIQQTIRSHCLCLFTAISQSSCVDTAAHRRAHYILYQRYDLNENQRKATFRSFL